MKSAVIFFIVILFFQNFSLADIGQTQITAEDGIEVFQKEKYYLLKNNVEIISDNFNLNADMVKAYFDKDLYDVIYIYAEGNVLLDSPEKEIDAKGKILEFTLVDEKIKITGKNSVLNLNKSSMYSDGIIEVNNSTGNFFLNGNNSKLTSEDIIVIGTKIKGVFKSTSEINEIIKLDVEDKNISNIKTSNIDMYSLNAIYDKDKNFIELIEKVKVIRGNEIITGDHGYVDIEKNSYKVTSNDSKKVKVIITEENE